MRPRSHHCCGLQMLLRPTGRLLDQGNDVQAGAPLDQAKPLRVRCEKESINLSPVVNEINEFTRQPVFLDSFRTANRGVNARIKTRARLARMGEKRHGSLPPIAALSTALRKGNSTFSLVPASATINQSSRFCCTIACPV